MRRKEKKKRERHSRSKQFLYTSYMEEVQGGGSVRVNLAWPPLSLSELQRQRPVLNSLAVCAAVDVVAEVIHAVVVVAVASSASVSVHSFLLCLRRPPLFSSNQIAINDDSLSSSSLDSAQKKQRRGRDPLFSTLRERDGSAQFQVHV